MTSFNIHPLPAALLSAMMLLASCAEGGSMDADTDLLGTDDITFVVNAKTTIDTDDKGPIQQPDPDIDPIDPDMPDEGEGPDPEEEDEDIASKNGSTFRILAFNIYEMKLTGTYYSEGTSEAELLHPCKLNDDGSHTSNVQNDSVEYGLIGASSSTAYRLYVLSPGIAQNEGVIKHVFSNKDNILYMTDCGDVGRAITGYGRINLTSYPLKDWRSRVGFKFYAVNNDENRQFSIASDATGTIAATPTVDLIGAGEKDQALEYFPITRQVYVPAKADGTTPTLPVTLKAAEPTSDNEYLCYETADEGYAYVPAAVYAVKDSVVKDLNIDNLYYDKVKSTSDNLSVNFFLNQGERKGIPIRLTFPNVQMEPLHTYVFGITVSSQYISVAVDVYAPETGVQNWQQVDKQQNNINKTPAYTLTLGTWKINEWEGERVEITI